MVLMIYNDQICKELLMPNLYNADYQIRLSATDYMLRADIVLQFERGGREWSLVSTSDYWIDVNERREEKHVIHNDDLINIKTNKGEKLIIIAAGDEIRLQTMEKYDLSGLREITIGRSPGNTIVYSFMSLISSSNAVLRRRIRMDPD